jgi:hypothetical protein
MVESLNGSSQRGIDHRTKGSRMTKAKAKADVRPKARSKPRISDKVQSERFREIGRKLRAEATPDPFARASGKVDSTKRTPYAP